MRSSDVPSVPALVGRPCSRGAAAAPPGGKQQVRSLSQFTI